VKAASSGISLQHTQQVVQLAVFGAFAFMVVLLQIGSEAQSCPLSAGVTNNAKLIHSNN